MLQLDFIDCILVIGIHFAAVAVFVASPCVLGRLHSLISVVLLYGLFQVFLRLLQPLLYLVETLLKLSILRVVDPMLRVESER